MENHMQEYPKALYLAGALAMAADEEQEADLREADYADWHVDQKRMQHGEGAADRAPEPTKPDTTALNETKAQLEELEMHLQAKDQDLLAKEQELSEREARLAEAEANLAARLAATATGAATVEGEAAQSAQKPAEEPAPARSRKKQDAAQ